MTLVLSEGDFVEARGRRWMVDGVSAGQLPQARLVCIDDDAQGEALDVCTSAEIALTKPADDAWALLSSTQPDDPAALGAHLRATRWQTSSAADRTLFQAPFRAGIRLDAYQLLPLQKALALPRANLLIADDVGLGKTVEAGLIARELLLRRRIDFIVIAAPASMVLQWQDEMAQKFGIDVSIVDREHLIDARRGRGFGANPWAVGSCFAISHSLLSDETYSAPLRAILGEFRARSLLILDEAHHAAPSSGQAYAVESQFTRSVRDLARRFEHRLFLSATPHNGHSNSFATLLEMLDPQRFTRGIKVEPADLEPVMVRRLKEDLRQLGERFPERKVERIEIRDLPEDSPELRLAGLLQNYWSDFGDLIGNRLLLGILQQRLFSSIASFRRTLQAHRRSISQTVGTIDLDLDDAEAERIHDDNLLVADASRPLDAASKALVSIDEMLGICDVHADGPDARVEAIIAWIKSELLDGIDWRARRLIVFTEWEDTRRWLQDCLEQELGSLGVDCEDRIASFTGATDIIQRDRIKREFNAPFEASAIRILLCTDAAREGINLQTRCSDVIHFDLPWNPSRLEQRNGRIDRKLQPSPTVTCRYFVYAQREEDRVLEALVRKTETIRRELGPAGQVIRDEVEAKLSGGILRGSSDELSTSVESAASDGATNAEQELGETNRLERLKAEDDRLVRVREQARRRVGVDPEDLQSLVFQSLAKMGASLSSIADSEFGAFEIDPNDPVLQKPAWQKLIDELRPGRPPSGKDLAKWRAENGPRGILFSPPEIQPGQPEPQDVVQLHLEHRLVKRLISRFMARGFQDNLSRVAAIRSEVAQPRVVLMARLALYGPSARRLHEEIITVAAPWHEEDRGTRPLQPFGTTGEQTTLDQLEASLRKNQSVADEVLQRVSRLVAEDVEALKGHLEDRARQARRKAVEQLRENGAREADALRDLLARQLRRIENERQNYEPLAQLSFDLRSEEQRLQEEAERRQREADRRSWDTKIERLTSDLETEPNRVREEYEVRAQRLDPVGVVYLWPAD